MLHRITADGVLIVHLLFVGFIALGGFWARGHHERVIIHAATVAYAAVIQIVGFRCPLTPLENHFRRAAGDAGYEGGFVEHYIVRVLYPGGLDTTAKAVLLAALAAITIAAYAPHGPRGRILDRVAASPSET